MRKKVRIQVTPRVLRTPLMTCIIMQSAEVDQLKSKLRQYDDYDEIKRELEIMKVCGLYILILRYAQTSCLFLLAVCGVLRV